MAPIKRTADADTLQSKKTKHSADDRITKKPRNEASSKGAPKRVSDNQSYTKENEKKPTQNSLLKSEERAFPRGGASVLTPLEHKQIQAEATRDVLFEQSNKKNGIKASGSDSDSDNEPGATGVVPTQKKSKKSKTKTKNIRSEKHTPKVRIEGLSYKRLVPGSFVLGQVTQITSRDVALALPNNLTGFIPLTAVSNQLSTRVEKLLESDNESEQEKAESDDEDDIELNKLFYIGQYLRAVVTSGPGSNPVGSKAKRRIELSINPQQANMGISKSDITVNCMVQASVISNEEHGLVMDLGLTDPNLKGFMSSKKLPQGIKHPDVQEGTVFLCLVTGLSSDGRVIKLSSDHHDIGSLKKLNVLTEASTINVFLPGTGVEVLITDSSASSFAGKVLGMLDVTADLVHSGSVDTETNNSERYKIGNKVKARVTGLFGNTEPRKLLVSTLDHILTLSSCSSKKGKSSKIPTEVLPLSSTVESAKVVKVEPANGLFLDLGVPGVLGFAHISRISDAKIETLLETSGPYKLDSTHPARVIGYNAMDGLFLVSLEKSILEQPFLRIEDILIGQIVKGKVEKIVITGKGAAGLIINLAEGISGFVPETHMADIHLQHPERKFKEGLSVTGRVLSLEPGKRQVRLTLKKSLVNSEADIWSDYSNIHVGSQAPGTLINIIRSGAVVQFYGSVRAWLPVSEMSEAYIEDPTQHFRLGQVVNVHVVSVDPEEKKMVVSCKDPSSFGLAQQTAFEEMKVGDIVQGSITEKSDELITVDVKGSGIKGILRLGQLTDGSEKKNASAIKRLRVGQELEDLVILDKLEKKPLIILTNKPSLVNAAKSKNLISKSADIREGREVHGFVRNITPERVFIEFAGGLVGLLFKSRVADSMLKLPDFGLVKDQSITTTVAHVDPSAGRFWLSMKGESKEAVGKPADEKSQSAGTADEMQAPLAAFSFGKEAIGTITAVKNTQLNVRLTDDVQGRIDVSEVFDNWDDIENKKHPLFKFQKQQSISVRVLGIHDARNHRFLPISHRAGKNHVLELTAKASQKLSTEADVLSIDKIKTGSTHVAFVNNVARNFVWVHLSPNVRGRIPFMDLSDDASLLNNVEKNFPVGCALKVKVKRVDTSGTTPQLDLTAALSRSNVPLTWKTIKQGMVLPGRVTKVSERFIVVQLNEEISGPVQLTELTDDFSQANPTVHNKNDIISVYVLSVDPAGQRLDLSTRPSNLSSSHTPVKDRQITHSSQLQVNDIARGFVKNITDKGLFVALGAGITAFVRISDLSDSFLKDWQSAFEVDQLVTGKVVSVDTEINHVQLSLKASVVDKDYVPPLAFKDVNVGQIVTAKVRKVEDFGVFIVVDNSANVSGLCHRSEIADEAPGDIKKLYKEGDAVKAIVLKKDEKKRRINFGMKWSCLQGTSEESDSDMEDGGGIPLDGSESEDEEMDDASLDLNDVRSIESDSENTGVDTDGDIAMEDNETKPRKAINGLTTSGFDWTGDTLGLDGDDASGNSDDGEATKKKKRRKPEIKIDRTGELDKHAPRSVADFERLLLGQPNSSALWVQYINFQLDLNEVDKAREIANRALRTIYYTEEKDKMRVRGRLLSLENSHGSEESVEEVFKDACQYHDPREVHEELVNIYIKSGKLEKADELYQKMAKNKNFTQDPDLWINYASFLMSTLNPPSPTRARALLQRATQSVPDHGHAHRHLTAKFGALEFKSENGDTERGRTIFEGLLSTWPKAGDIWDMFVELEKSHGIPENVRSLYERMVKIASKKHRKRLVYKNWAKFEEEQGNKKGVERVMALEKESLDSATAEGE